MSNGRSLAEVDRLLEVLDHARVGPPPRAEIETLHRAYVSARRLEERARWIYGCAAFGLTIAWLLYLFTSGTLRLPDWLNPTVLVLVTLHLLTLEVFRLLFPVLRRRERVVTLLEYFDADLSQVDGPYGRKIPPPSVLNAIEALERAQGPADLGPAYSAVERWSGKAHGLNFDRLYVAFFWLVAVVVAISGDQIGFPDFWRGAAAGVAAAMALQYYLRTQEERSARRRAEDALGRWRHLVPAMRELPQ